MPRHGHMRHGSLQFYPRKRAAKILPKINWNSVLKNKTGLLGFIGYKVGMKSAYVKDNTPNSLTKGQKIIIPVTILEFPEMKTLSIRFYKNNKVLGEVLNQNLDKELKRKLKLPKIIKNKIENFKDFDDLKIIFYSVVNKTGIKKTPDICEIALSGTKEEKIDFVKNSWNKPLNITDFLKQNDLVDVSGVTKGKGFQGPTKRFGLTLRAHKSEKGVRGPGSGGPWHPARVEYTQPKAGQMGFFTRAVYNNKVVFVGNVAEKDINDRHGFNKFGKIKSYYAIIFGSLQGPSKRQLLITAARRPSKNQIKKNYEFIELR